MPSITLEPNCQVKWDGRAEAERIEFFFTFKRPFHMNERLEAVASLTVKPLPGCRAKRSRRLRVTKFQVKGRALTVTTGYQADAIALLERSQVNVSVRIKVVNGVERDVTKTCTPNWAKPAYRF